MGHLTLMIIYKETEIESEVICHSSYSYYVVELESQPSSLTIDSPRFISYIQNTRSYTLSNGFQFSTSVNNLQFLWSMVSMVIYGMIHNESKTWYFYQHSIMMTVLSVYMIYHRSIYSGAFKIVRKVNCYCVIVSVGFICKFNYVSGLPKSTGLTFFF